MKKQTVWAVLAVTCFAFCASAFLSIAFAAAPNIPAEYADCLYPIKVDGKWGYMDYAGEVVIPPQWAYAGEFANGVALVSAMGSKEHCNDGLIDAKGEYVLPPEYSIERNGAFFRVRAYGEDGKLLDGYYDALRGVFLPPFYDLIVDWSVTDDTPLILAYKDGLCGFLNRATGKVAIPFQYTGEHEEAGYSEGYLLAADEVHWENGDLSFQIHLLDMEGHEVHFPEGIMASSGVHEGLLRIEREAQEGESSAWGTLYGFAKPDGSIVVPPKYDYAEDFCEGYTCVYKDGKFGHIDQTGREIVPPKYDLSSGGEMPYYFFHDGYAILELADSSIILDTQGNVVFEQPWNEKGMYYSIEWCDLGIGLVWYSQWPEKDFQGRRYGLMKADGTKLTEVIWEAYADREWEDGMAFSQEGLQAVKRSGLWGYMDAAGAECLPFMWDDANNFINGLARVEKDGKMAYINRGGNVVWQEE